MREINKIIIHCAATPNGRDVHAADIDRWHKQRGWSGIGYHFVVALDGEIEPGRPLEVIGAHCKGHNRDSIGICLIGTDRFTQKQWRALERLLAHLSLRFPEATVHGHREFNPHKLCPGFDVSLWLTEQTRTEQAHLWLQEESNEEA